MFDGLLQCLVYLTHKIDTILALFFQAHKHWGFGLCFLYLHNVKGFSWNHNRIYRIYQELDLNLRFKPRKRLKRDKPDELSVSTKPNQIWSMGFMSDALEDSRAIRSLNVIDDYISEGLAVNMNLSMPSLLKMFILSDLMDSKT